MRRSAEERQALVAAWQSSGLSASAFERREGLTPWSLARWKRRAEAKASQAKLESRPSISFAPVHITKSETKTVLVERMLAEVVIGRDVRVRIVDGADLEQVTLLVRALAGGLVC